ncbi:MAG: PAS domain S-box protein [Leptolyngbya sp. SIO4C1]|nr:PAS domain S-box protein [Leptolyngbya sp. SIO4C1]
MPDSPLSSLPAFTLERFLELSVDLLAIAGADGYFKVVSPSFEQVLGYACSELLARPFLSLVHPADRARSQAQVESLIAGQQTVNFKNRNLCQDGTIKWLEWNARSYPEPETGDILFYCVGRDITARKQAEAENRRLNTQLEARVRQRTEALQQAQRQTADLLAREHAARELAETAKAEIQLYADAIQNMQDGFYLWQLEAADDPRSFRLIATNPAAAQLTGIPADTVLGKQMIEGFPALFETNIPQRYQTIVNTGKEQDIGEVVYGPSGSQKTYAVKAFPLPQRCVGVLFEDVTERRATLLALQQQRDQLAQANRLLATTTASLEERNQELDQFAYVTSHDLKAPLRAIANLAAWLEDDLGDALPEENHRQLQLLQGRVHRMENLINGLLAYSRVGRTGQSSEPVDVGALLVDVIDSLAPPPTVSISMGPMPVLIAKRLALQQVFSNLLGNAIKHHPRANSQITIACQERGGQYVFSVADDGAGIAPEYHEKIFTIFQVLEARDKVESTGIGLSIVKKIVESEGGQITVTSALGKGATFSFTWPKADQR